LGEESLGGADGGGGNGAGLVEKVPAGHDGHSIRCGGRAWLGIIGVHYRINKHCATDRELVPRSLTSEGTASATRCVDQLPSVRRPGHTQ
jgi:hypothetical protein